MHANDSPIQSLQKLKDLLDVGALTRQEYELLKHKIISPLLDEDAAATPAPDHDLLVMSDPAADEPITNGLLPASELVEGPEEETGPPAADLPPKLDVDHLLASGEDNPGSWQEMAPKASYGQTSRLGELRERSSPDSRFEPGKIENFADFSPLRGREPRSGLLGRGRMLDLVLLISILCLIGFGAYIYYDQQVWESEQIVSRRTESAGGLALPEEQADLSSPAVIPPEAPAGGEQAPSAKPTNKDPASASPPAQKKVKLQPVAPEAPASKPADPAVSPAEAVTPAEQENESGKGREEAPVIEEQLEDFEIIEGEEALEREEETEPEITPLAPKPPAPLIEESSPEEEEREA